MTTSRILRSRGKQRWATSSRRRWNGTRAKFPPSSRASSRATGTQIEQPRHALNYELALAEGDPSAALLAAILNGVGAVVADDTDGDLVVEEADL